MRCAIIILIVLAVPALVHAATLNVPSQYSTIQQAIDAASGGDTVLVEPGIYYELIDFKGKAITVMSSDGPDITFICGGFFGSVVTFKSGEGLDSVLDGFSIVYGSGTFDPTYGYIGGGIYCIGSSPFIKNNIIRDNQADYGGGIEAWQGSSPMIAENIISNNLAMGSWDSIGGGAGICTSYDSSPTILKNTIIDNTHTGPSWKGGGVGIMFTYNSAPLIEDNIISYNNSLNGNGGAIYIYDSCSSMISNNLICSNSVGRACGAIAVHLNCSVVISNNIICRNSAAWFAGAIRYTGDTTITITGNIIYENAAQGDSGAITCGNPGSIASITNNIIYGNTGETGGGVWINNGAKATITNNTIYGNSASVNGGGICCEGATVTITNTILWNNNDSTVSEIWVGKGSWPSTANLWIRHSDLEGGKESITLAPGSFLNWGSGMIDSDPLFVEPISGDFHLSYPSPCKDSGLNLMNGLPDEDYEGDPRIAYGTVDMGADEFYTHLYWTGDATPGGNVEIKFVGLPGTSPVGLCIGTGVLDPPLKSMWGDWYLQFPIIGPLGFGSIPSPDGVLIIPRTIPGTPPAPYAIPMQALIGTQLTNLCVMEVE